MGVTPPKIASIGISSLLFLVGCNQSRGNLPVETIPKSVASSLSHSESVAKPKASKNLLAEKRCPGCDLQGVYLKNANLSNVDLSGADLGGAENS
jgi:uncharacterized protein YjbI with pentapeptide repeats